MFVLGERPGFVRNAVWWVLSGLPAEPRKRSKMGMRSTAKSSDFLSNIVWLLFGKCIYAGRIFAQVGVRSRQAM